MAAEITSQRGHPVLKIIERAKESGRTLILMGTHGKGFVEELFLGSVAHNVARRAPRPQWNQQSQRSWPLAKASWQRMKGFRPSKKSFGAESSGHIVPTTIICK